MNYKLLPIVAVALFAISCEKTEKVSDNVAPVATAETAKYPTKIAATKAGFITTTEGQSEQKLSNPTASIKQYLAYVPKGYNKYQTLKWPLVIYLHNANAKGTDLNRVRASALPKLADVANNDYQFVLISPQLEYNPSTWDPNDLNTMLAEVSAKYSIDPNLIVLTGEGLGGNGTWSWALQKPNLFTAIIPIGGWSVPGYAANLKNVPTWAFSSNVEPQSVQAMVNSLKSAGGNVKYTGYNDDEATTGAKVYSDPNVLKWATDLIVQKVNQGSSAAPEPAPVTPPPAFVQQTEGQVAHNMDNPTGSITQYLTYIPQGYNSQPNTKWPLVIYLHGNAELGTDINQIYWTYGAYKTIDRKYPWVQITPQLRSGNGGWNINDLNKLLDEVSAKYNIDPSRILISGYSLGGIATWAWAENNPQRFAGIVVESGNGDVSKAYLLKDMGVAAYHGAKDPVLPYQNAIDMVNAIKAAGGTKANVTIYPNGGHIIHTEMFSDDNVANWMLAQHK